MSAILLRQTLIMFIYMLVGLGLFRWGKLTRQGSREMAALLVNLIIPVVIVNSFCIPRTPEKLSALGLSILGAALALLVAILIARLLFPKHPIDNFAAAFSNAGFIGIPLVQAALGEEAVFYLVPFVMLLNILQWTYGVAVLTGEKGAVQPKSILLNPIMAGTAAGLVIFLTGLGGALPTLLSAPLKGIAAMNSPVAMIILGVYLAQTDALKMLRNRRLYWVSAVRLLIVPAVTCLVLLLLPMGGEIRQTLLIAAAAPVGANVAIYAQLHNMDYPYACQTVVITTLLSIVTLPLVALLGTALF